MNGARKKNRTLEIVSREMKAALTNIIAFNYYL